MPFLLHRRHRGRSLSVFAAALFATATTSSFANAAPPEPSGPHPRILLDAKKRASLKEKVKDPSSATSRAVRQCTKVAGSLPKEAKNLYMGLDWAAHAQTCALAFHATGDAAHAKTALHFFSALLDDWENVGDGKGGDGAARNDHGYAIRAFGVTTALIYDWLHDAPGMTPAMLAKARGRFTAWTDWYYADPGGYRFKDAGTNYHAGYVFAATAMAIAEGSEGGAGGAKLWRHVVDTVWAKDMKPAAAPGGLLEGGDWGEGWQYGPLAVASYAIASRAMIEQGIALPEFEKWAEQIVLRDIHARSPNDKGMFVGGDTQNEAPSIQLNAWTLASVIAGPTSDTAAGWAKAEMERLKLTSDDKSFLMFEVLAEARNVAAVPFPRATASTFYLAKGTGTLHARSSWSPTAAWMAMQCTKTIEVDHLPPKAGNFVLTRGEDELVVDPSPYGSLSTLTSNAPTVESGHLPADYKPGQGWWSVKTHYDWAYQTESAIVAARCDYADQFKFQDNPSDVPMAVRDVVLVPSGAGDATVVVVDRATTGAASRDLFLRFRTTPTLALDGTTSAAKGTRGASSLMIRPVHLSSGKPEIKAFGKGDCFKADYTRGNCRAARFPVNDFSVTAKGPQPMTIHVIDAAGAAVTTTPPKMTAATTAGHRVVSFERNKRNATVVVAEPAAKAAATLSYRAPPGNHVVLDAPASEGGNAQVTAALKDGQCDVTVVPAASGGMLAKPLAIILSERCEVKLDGALKQPQLEGVSSGVVNNANATGATATNPTASVPSVRRGEGARGCGGCGVSSSSSKSAGLGALISLVAITIAARRRVQRTERNPKP